MTLNLHLCIPKSSPLIKQHAVQHKLWYHILQQLYEYTMVSDERGLFQCSFIHPFEQVFQLIVIFILDGIICQEHRHKNFTSSFPNDLCGDPSISMTA